MRKQLASAALASLLALFLSACAGGPATEAGLTDEAKAALAQAEKDVKDAKANFALWTTADKALKTAQEAAKKGDSETVTKQAKLASDHAKMGLAQTKYPSTEIK
ncbi:murein lipoprotein [Sulfuritortus calidifontis]|uniref:Murein lipoprotein n=1 Tax=Sulfuritortus calidifontis TaxID=1914471 RepID=A0A4V2UQM4_9PROT|nr:hypothetical protein [Sulfuritortus calidifontis]TCS71551.1 murein lipoprotein [Sulfuritortus calidifontis]